MYTKQCLHELGMQGTLANDLKQSLDENGFFIVENVLSDAQCIAMGEEFDRLHELENDRGGQEVHIEPTARRVSNIFNKSAVFDACLEIEPLLKASHYLLGEFKLHGANLRDPLPGGGHQDLHTDVPKYFADDWWVTNAVIAFDDIREDNGPMRAVPGSHHWQPINVADVNAHDWQPAELDEVERARVPADLGDPYPGEIIVTAPRGSAIVINSSLWHSGTLHKHGPNRRVLHLTYTRRDLPQQLVQRRYLTPALFDRMSEAHRYMMDIAPLPEGVTPMLEPAGKQSDGSWWKAEA